MSRKAELEVALSDVLMQKGKAQASLERYQEARSKLASVSDQLDYVLKSHENIKSNYHLAGTPYLKMTTSEEDSVKEIKSKLVAKKEDLLALLDAKIRIESLRVMSLAAEATSLSQAIMLVGKEK